MGDKINQRNIFGSNLVFTRVAGVVTLRNRAERHGFVKGIFSGLVVWVIVHFGFGA